MSYPLAAEQCHSTPAHWVRVNQQLSLVYISRFPVLEFYRSSQYLLFGWSSIAVTSLPHGQISLSCLNSPTTPHSGHHCLPPPPFPELCHATSHDTIWTIFFVTLIKTEIPGSQKTMFTSKYWAASVHTSGRATRAQHPMKSKQGKERD